ncbi:hypothetical protein RND81_06G154700 [Saponaria officinalis]|uniref:HTH myb-type domain-containing protein n=1 Tax=Saponaria officinalis TaxID=3572 RepID=A0AAW1KC23_SAPOF
MMGSSSELSLECKTQSYSMLLKSFGEHNQQHDQATQKLEDYLTRLEEERLKIDAFKRELPLCMQLLTNAMEASRQQLQTYKANQGTTTTTTTTRPILEEFIPLKNSSNIIEGSIQKQSNISDKANWMTSAQLWSQTTNDAKTLQSSSNLPKIHEINNNNHINFNNVIGPNINNLGLDTKQRNGGAFLPFSKNPKNESNFRALPELALASSEEEIRKNNESENGMNGGSMSSDNNSSRGGGNNNGVTNGNHQGIDGQTTATNTTTTTNSNQTHRKARRCWSPDLHRRFVNALQMLGGSQVATPKQIRELMKVDGLTNDEVKSHLQKYRLHTRRPSPSPQTTGGPAPQLVVLGGIWVPPEYANAAAGGPTMYSTHPATSQVSPHYCSTVVPQEYYSAPPPLPPSQPQLHHQQQLHMYKTTSHTQTHSSPETDTQGAGDRSESIEDGKSESSG